MIMTNAAFSEKSRSISKEHRIPTEIFLNLKISGFSLKIEIAYGDEDKKPGKPAS
jgi:hypothetical protein